MHNQEYFKGFVGVVCLFFSACIFALEVAITAQIDSVEVLHAGEKITIMRDQDLHNTIASVYAKTSRPCPAFCIQPAKLAHGVETIAELEILEYLQLASETDSSVLVIDSRTPDWLKHGTIPGSVNIPWTELKQGAGADPFTITDILQQQFGVRLSEGLWDFSGAKTLVLFCNGMWCGQSPANIKTLLRLGYPPHKLKWYRGGMQAWQSLGLTIVE